MSNKLSTDELNELRDAFEFFDEDGSGTISSDEIASAMRYLGSNPTNADIRRAIKEVDQNGDGVLDFDEFCVIMTKFCPPEDQEKKLRKAFEWFDTDKNGSLSKDEMETVMLNFGDKLTLNEVDALFEDVDTNKDGVIDIDEFVQLMSKFTKKQHIGSVTQRR